MIMADIDWYNIGERLIYNILSVSIERNPVEEYH